MTEIEEAQAEEERTQRLFVEESEAVTVAEERRGKSWKSWMKARAALRVAKRRAAK